MVEFKGLDSKRGVVKGILAEEIDFKEIVVKRIDSKGFRPQSRHFLISAVISSVTWFEDAK